MQFGRRVSPEHFLPADWDEAWSLGWFRMRQTLFTTHFLTFDGSFRSAIWLRNHLDPRLFDGGFRSVVKRNQRWSVEFEPLPVQGPSLDHEVLYQKYRRSVPFEPAPTLRDLLYGDSFHDRFPSWWANVYDGSKLIAAGIFDRGDRSAAGINAFYDPEYRSYSLGKFLILKKMEFCYHEGHEWFYPGYVSPGEPRFDYKWTLGRQTLEYWDLGAQSWQVPKETPLEWTPLAEMVARLEGLAERARHRSGGPVLRYYSHLDINLNPQIQGVGLFDFPVFLDWFGIPGLGPVLMVVFDPRSSEYLVLHARNVYQLEPTSSRDDVFDSGLLHVEEVLFRSSDLDRVFSLMGSLQLVQQA